MRSYRNWTAVAAILFVFASTAKAQDIERIETNLVTLNVSVDDRKGSNVRGLAKNDFEVFDNGVKQQIDVFSAEAAPVSFGIVYDLHPSTEERTRNVLAALRRFTDGLEGRDEFFVHVFNDRGSLATDFVPDSEQVRTQIAAGPRSLYDAMFAASERVHRMRNPKKLLIVISDQGDRASGSDLKQLRLRLRSINLPVYSVMFSNAADTQRFSYIDVYRDERPERLGIGDTSQLDRDMLSELSRSTGGQVYETALRDRYYIAALCSKALEEVRNQYVIGFTPDQLDGKWHKLRVTVARPEKYNVASRKGYQSATKK